MKIAVASALVLVALPAAARAGETPPASDGRVSVATEVVPTEPGQADTRLRLMVMPTTLVLETAAPAGVKAPAAGASRPLYATLPTPGKKTAVAFVRGAGDAATLHVDVNGDGAFEGAAESFPSTGEATKGTGTKRNGTAWKLANTRLGEALVTFAFQERLAGLSVILSPTERKLGADGKPVAAARLDLEAAAPAGVEQAPALGGEVRWAKGVFDGAEVVVAVARGTGDLLSVVVAKAGEADLSKAKALEAKGDVWRQGLVRVGTRWSFPNVDAGGKSAQVTVMAAEEVTTGTAVPASTRRGTAKVGDVEWTLCLADGDFDGKIRSEDDLWWFGPTGDVERLNYANSFEGNEPMREKDGKAWRLQSVAADGTVLVSPEPNPEPAEEYFHRRSERINKKVWFPQFAPGVAEFAKQQDIDLARPKAAAPATWHHMNDFEAAKALASREGKPLLVDFEADWCVWCKRLDYHTYPDAEVVAALSKFTCVKINNEFDPAKTFRSFKGEDGKPWGGIPSIGIFDKAGKPVRFSYVPGHSGPDAKPKPADHIVGFLPPQLFVKALEAARAAWEASAK
jgi:thiol-disulfide isomerase/thioredoxin